MHWEGLVSRSGEDVPSKLDGGAGEFLRNVYNCEGVEEGGKLVVLIV